MKMNAKVKGMGEQKISMNTYALLALKTGAFSTLNTISENVGVKFKP